VNSFRAFPNDLTYPTEIAARTWHYALNHGKPIDHHNNGFGESFKVGIGNGRATIYVRINDRHLRFEGAANTPHHACIAHAARTPLSRRPADERFGR
jgi:hypothetical protein